MKLSDFELDVMQLFWDGGDNVATDIHKQITLTKPVTYNTVKTIIDRLEDKGALLRAHKVGRNIIYRAAIEKSSISNQLLPLFLNRFFKGNSRQLISHLIGDEKVTDDDIIFLEKLIAEKKAKGKL
jgi:BlaI family penicillinase repressor